MFYSNELKDFIESKGLKQRYISEQAEIDETRLSRILAGKSKCTAEEYFRICRVLKVPYERFCHD
ncbi:MAG: helix-turn-helix domain-containing protein [Allobaculum sp.]|uniref:helix-turn-helix domain-containing protein n=1 Tax=Allobaculum sp. TaxID=1872463 RepID=UPI00399996E8